MCSWLRGHCVSVVNDFIQGHTFYANIFEYTKTFAKMFSCSYGIQVEFYEQKSVKNLVRLSCQCSYPGSVSCPDSKSWDFLPSFLHNSNPSAPLIQYSCAYMCMRVRKWFDFAEIFACAKTPRSQGNFLPWLLVACKRIVRQSIWVTLHFRANLWLRGVCDTVESKSRTFNMKTKLYF